MTHTHPCAICQQSFDCDGYVFGHEVPNGGVETICTPFHLEQQNVCPGCETTEDEIRCAWGCCAMDCGNGCNARCGGCGRCCVCPRAEVTA